MDYSITLHDGKGRRILGFDNAHAISEGSGPGAKTRIEYDHTHKGERVRFYNYKDAVTLLTDFWTEADKILNERNTKP
jgi:ribosomal protein S18